jgi:carnosine N-methyltransferase
MSHHRSTEDLIRSVLIPDENPANGIRLSGTKGEMSMVAGDFIECYSTPENAGTFSVVVTIFFIDTAPNVLKYLETIHHVLEPNGVWINLGPLAWHFEPDSDTTRPSQTGGSIELTLTELLSVIKKIGFTFETEEGLSQRTIQMPYMANNRGMLTYLYETEFWVARKL